MTETRVTARKRHVVSALRVLNEIRTILLKSHDLTHIREPKEFASAFDILRLDKATQLPFFTQERLAAFVNG